jgi:tetratricopeptide (TPR) repeat protein
MPTEHVGGGARRSVGTMAVPGLMVVVSGALIWGAVHSSDLTAAGSLWSLTTGSQAADTRKEPPRPARAPTGRVEVIPPPRPVAPPEPPAPQEPVVRAEAVVRPEPVGPRTAPAARQTPPPATGTEIVSTWKDTRSAGMGGTDFAVHPASATQPAGDLPLPRPVGPAPVLPPLPEPKADSPPVPKLPPDPKPPADAKPLVLPDLKPEPRDGGPVSLPSGPAPLPPTPGGSAVPAPPPGAAPGAVPGLTPPGLAAPGGPPAKPYSTALIAVPGVSLPVPPPVLRPLPKANPVPEQRSYLFTAPQEKLPEPRKLDVPPDVAIRLARARNAMKSGDLALAITEFEQYLAAVPNDVAVRAELAGVYTQAERFTAAATAYQELIRLAPENAPLYLLSLSDLQGRLKDYRAAVASLRRALELLPDDPKDARAAAQRADTAARLARVHLADEDLPSAFGVVQQYLAGLKPGDAAVPIRYVSFLLDLERGKEAAPFLDPFVRAIGDNPDPEVLVNNVRLYAILGDKRKAYDAMELLAAKLPKSIGPRLQLAENLTAIEEYDLAAVMFAQIPAIQANHVPSQLAQVRMLIAQYRLTQAKGLLETVRPLTPDQVVEASLVRGQYHIAAGQFIEAKYFYNDILKQFPYDPDARIGLAAAYEAGRDLEKAKAEYSRVLPGSRGYRRARRGVATALAGQRRIAAALDVLTALQREAPWDHQTLIVYAQVSTRNGYAQQAIEACGSFLAGGSPTASAFAAVEGAMGNALLAANKVAEAEAAFRSALAATANRSLVGQYGLLRVSQRLVDGPGDLGCPPEFVGDEIRFRLTVSDLFAEDRDDGPALQHALTALRGDPQNLAALTRVADLQQRVARQTGVVEDAVSTAKALLVASPTNVRGHLALARSYSIARNFKASSEVYQKLISLDSDYTLPKREVARIYYADYRYDLSHEAYLSVGTPDPESGLRSALTAIGDRAPAVNPAIVQILAMQNAGPGLGSDAGRLASAVSDPLVAQSLMAAVTDYEARVAEARAAEARGARLEDTAKGLRGLRDLSAVGAYRAVIEQEPGNVDALFDLAQTYGSLQKTREANKVYGQVLAADPQSRESSIALQRGQAEMAPSVRPFIGYQEENGRNGLAQMGRFRVGSLVTLPLGDANEFFGVGYSHVNYNPRDDGDLNGDIATVTLQKKLGLNDQVLFRTVTNYEQYASRLSNRVTTDTGLVYRGDGYNLSGGGYVENVPVSGEALRQDIYRYGFQMSGDYRVNRRVDVAGLYRYGYYSDSNNLQEFTLNAGYRFTQLPRQLRLLVNVQGLFYSDQTQFGPNAPFDLRGTIHPYFAPSSFSFYEARLEWTHIVGRDLFGGANNLTYVAQYGLGWDNRSVSYNRFRLDVTWDVKSWLTAGLATEYLYSGVFRYGSVYAYMTIRLPHIYHL